MYPLVRVPAFGGESPSFVDYEHRAKLRNQSAEVDPSKRGPTSSSRVETFARLARLNAGGDTFMRGEGAETSLKTLRSYFQPDAIDRIYQQECKFSLKKRADQNAERCLLEFDGLRRKGEALVITGWPFPHGFVSILPMRMRPCRDAASARGPSGFPIAAKQMRRVFEPCGSKKSGKMFSRRRIAIWGRRRQTRLMMLGRLIAKPGKRGQIPPESHAASRAARIKLKGMVKCCMALIDARGGVTVAAHAVASITWLPSALSEGRGSQTACPVRLQ